MPTIKLPIQRLDAEFLAATPKREDRTAEVRFYSGATIRRFNWEKGDHDLTFSMEPSHVRLGRLNSGRAPLLNSHSDWSVSDVIGVVEKGWLENAQGRARVRFSQREAVEPIWQDVQDGILRNISMGAAIHKLKETTEEGDKIRSFLAVDWEPHELSVVPVGADPKAAFLTAKQETECEVELALRAPKQEQAAEVGPNRATSPQENTMEQENQTIEQAGAAARSVNLDAVRQAERERIARLTSLGAKWKKPAAFVSEHIDKGTTVEEYGRLILDEAAERDERVQTRSGNTQTTGGPFRNLGEYLQAVARSCSPDQRVDQRLIKLATGMNEAIDSEGGFLVQTDYSLQLMAAATAQAIVVPKCTSIPISGPSNGVKLPAISETSRADGSRSGGVQMYWKNEAAAKTASKPAFRLVELSLKKLVGLCYATDELLQDVSALEAYIRAAFAAEAAFKLDDAVIRGLGAGVPLGVLNAPCLVTVAKEDGQLARTVVADNIVKMFSRMYAGGVQNAVWLVNQDVFPQLYTMGITVGTGGSPIYLPPGGLSGSPYSTLFGRPVIPIEQCSTLGTVGDIIFGDFTQYLVATKGGLETASSIHLLFNYDETCFRFVYRFDGSPAWQSALTPYQAAASYTVGPFIALATRA